MPVKVNEIGIITKSFDAIIKADSASGRGEITGVWTTGEEDREKDIIEIAGWDLTDFNRNPIMLYDHDTKQLPVGQVTSIWFDSTKGYFDAEFAAHMRAQEIRQLFIDGILRTFSMRYLPVEWGYIDNVGYGRRFTKQKLIEISVVPIPANVNAEVITAKSASQPERLRLVRPKRIAAWALEVLDNYKKGVKHGRERKHVG